MMCRQSIQIGSALPVAVPSQSARLPGRQTLWVASLQGEVKAIGARRTAQALGKFGSVESETEDAQGIPWAEPGSWLSAARKHLVSDAIARQHHRTANFSKFELS